MKKLFNKRFALILGSTITLLVVLTVAMVFITKGNVKTFTRSGYIIASSKESSTKYYFDEGTSYKKNINSELVFEDTSGEKVNVENSNFLHYIDGGIKFLKNGVIMDLDSVNESIVPYYNITNKSLLEYSKKSYYIETIDKTLAFNNLIGRISENKYIVAGVDINLQLAGNDKEITGDYFEITFVEDGIIKVENQEVAYQTTAQDSYILVGDDVTIDLGVKKVYYNDEERMSLTQMTIDGNENIEIIPTDEDEEDTPQGGEGQPGQNQDENTVGGDGSGTGTGDGTTGDGTGDETDGEAGDGTGEGSGGNGGSGGGVNLGRKAGIELVEAKVGVNDITAKFYINDPDSMIKNDLVVDIINMDTSLIDDPIKIDKAQKEFNVVLSDLEPNTNYLLSINEELNGEYVTQYFQKLFKTDNLGIDLEKVYVSSSEVQYKVVFDDDSLVKSVRLRLLDENYNDIEGVEPENERTRENSVATFTGLKANKSYIVYLDNVKLDTIEYTDKYTDFAAVKTLKKSPKINKEDLVAQINDEETEFTIGIDNITNGDSITKYSYYIYNADEFTEDNINSRETVIDPIPKNDASKVKIKIDGDKIKSKTNYKFKVVVEYFDNEKTVEYETDYSEGFILAERPQVEFIMDFEKSTYRKIVGTIVIVDENCTVPLKGRECSTKKDYENEIYVNYYIKGEQLFKKVNLDFKVVVDEEFNSKYAEKYGLKENSETLQAANVEFYPLDAGVIYAFDVYGDVDLRNNKPINKGMHIGTFEKETGEVIALYAKEWKQNDIGVEDLINVDVKIEAKNGNHLVGDSLKKLKFNLYEGKQKANIDAGVKPTPIDSAEVSEEVLGFPLKDIYYNKTFTISTLNTFGIKDEEIITEEGTTISRAIDVLKGLTGGKLPEYYTIEITDVYDETGTTIPIEDNIFEFKTPPMIRIEENEATPMITVDEITNENLITSKDTDVDSSCAILEEEFQVYNKSYNKELSCGTKVGYKVDIQVNINTLKRYFSEVNELIYYVCDADINKNCTIENAVYVEPPINLNETDVTEKIFYLENGTAYEEEDKVLTRGHNYIFKAKFKVSYIKDEEGTKVNALYPTTTVKKEVSAPKQGATYSIYIDKTTDNEVYYKYKFTDIDKTLYDNKFYYSVNDGEVKTYDFSEEAFVISGLSNDSVYDISFKSALYKTESSIETKTVGKYIFDGKYSYTKDTINFENLTYENDNRLRILILENELNKSLIDRISAYELRLSAEGVNDYVKMYSSNSEEITTCSKDDKEYRCIIVDYADIKDFKSKDTEVNLTAYYDSGIINNDFANIKDNKVGFILQSNNIYNPDKIKGNYIYINKFNGYSVNSTPIDIYHYEGNTETKLQITNIINKGYRTQFLDYANDSISFRNTGVSINNKVLEKTPLGTNNSKFRFNSFIPTISVSSEGLIDGAIITIEPSGLDAEIIKNEFKEESGKHYYYLKIYDDAEKTNLIKTEKVEINADKSVITFSKYYQNTTYYFEVYAYMLKEKEYKETKLFDIVAGDKYETSLYSFSTLAPEKISFQTQNYAKYASTSTEGNYSVRNLTLRYNTNKNIGAYQVKMELLDIDNNVLYSEVTEPKSSNLLSYDFASVEKNIAEIEEESGKEFVYGFDYYSIKIYTLIDVYDKEEKESYLVYEGVLNSNNSELKPLSAPTIGIEKEEGINDLTFTISIIDNDKVIVDGKYCVKLVEDDESDIPGQPERCGLSALELKKEIFNNLKSDNLYRFIVTANTYRNNVGEANVNNIARANIRLSTSTDYGVALGSVGSTLGEKTIVLTYESGVNIKNIKRISYRISVNKGSETYSGEYEMGVDKNFSQVGEKLQLVINPEGFTRPKSGVVDLTLTYWVEVDFDHDGVNELVRLNDTSYPHTFTID